MTALALIVTNILFPTQTDPTPGNSGVPTPAPTLPADPEQCGSPTRDPDDPSLACTQEVINWIYYLGVAACMAAILYGIASLGLSMIGGNSGSQQRGKMYIIAGIVGVVVLSMAPSIMNQLVELMKQSST